MSIRYYDQAVCDKIKNWVLDQNMTILSPGDSTRLFQMELDKNNDKPIKLPLISISRDTNIEITNTNKRVLTYDGAHLDATNNLSEVLNAVPIKLSYQIDIYTKYFAEADEYVRNFVFNIINYPRLSIEIPYNNSKITHNSTMLLESTITDASDVAEKLIAGQFTRMTLRTYIDDAWLFSVPIKKNWKVEMGEIKVREDK